MPKRMQNVWCLMKVFVFCLYACVLLALCSCREPRQNAPLASPFETLKTPASWSVIPQYSEYPPGAHPGRRDVFVVKEPFQTVLRELKRLNTSIPVLSDGQKATFSPSRNSSIVLIDRGAETMLIELWNY